MGTVDYYLLTGAGFSKNFGGLLATEIWAAIFNRSQVQAAPELRARLLADHDFEAVYHEVITSGKEEDKSAIVEAVFEAYKQLDDSLRGFSFAPGSPYPVNIYKVQALLAAFVGRRGDPGYIFTLNQDLFLERHYYNGPRPVLPGVRQPTDWFSTHFTYPLDRSRFVDILSKEELAASTTSLLRNHELVYLKLHGSCNWRSSDSPTQMIIGRDKVDQIERHHLLSWYYDLFRSRLARPDSRLLTIGYGFADPHINKAISECIEKSRLGVYVLGPTSAAAVVKRIGSSEHGKEILAGLKAFYEVDLQHLFPADQQETSMWRQIMDKFFGRRIP